MSFVPLSRVLTKISPSVNVEPGSSYPNAGVLNRGRGLFAKPPLAGGATAATKLYRLSAGNVVYSKLFAWEGSVALVSDEFDGSYVSSEFPIFEVDQEAADLRYLYHALTWSKTLEQISAMGSGLGQRRQRVNPDRFVTAEIPLPPLAHQRRIGAHLDSVAEAQRNVEASQWNLARRSQALMEVVWQGSGYPSARAGECLVLDREPVTIDPEGRYRQVGVRGFGRGLLSYPEGPASQLSKLRYFRLGADRLVLSNIKAWEGAVAVTGADEGGRIASNRFLQYRGRDGVNPRFVAHWLVSRQGLHLLGEASPGSADRNRTLSIKNFEGIEIPLPDLAEQERVVRLLDTLKFAVGKKLAHRERVADALLPAARNEVFSRLR